MSALSPLQINLSYQGLLKLADSTTGITQTTQALQDGLGNDTGVLIAENRFEGSNIVNIYRPSGVGEYFGNGFSNSQSSPGAVQNTLVTNTFYDNGLYSYSAISVNCNVLESGSSVDIAFYNTQYLDDYGYSPYQKLISEVNIPTTSTGIKTVSFATPLSFSATGPGVYFMVIRYNTPGTPVVRLTGAGSNIATYFQWLLVSNFGLQYNTAGLQANSPFRVNSVSALSVGANYNTASFPTTWTATEFNLITATAAANFGFLLHTIR